MQNNFRGLVIRKNRYGDNDLAICSGFYGKIGIWKELPKAEEINDYTPYKHLSTNPEELEELTKHNEEIIKEKKEIKPTTFKFVMT